VLLLLVAKTLSIAADVAGVTDINTAASSYRKSAAGHPWLDRHGSDGGGGQTPVPAPSAREHVGL
jgi:hypothetical protein